MSHFFDVLNFFFKYQQELKDFYYFRKLAYSQVFLQSLDHLCVQVKIISNDYEKRILFYFFD